MKVAKSEFARTTSLVAIFLVLSCGAGQVAAEPSEAQIAAIKANCRSDYMSYCWSVPRGGPEAAQCLKKNLAKLSPGCQQAVKAATAAAAPPSPPAAETKAAAEAKPAMPPAEPAPSSAPAATAKAAAPVPELADQGQDMTAKAASPAGSAQSAPSTGETAAKEAAPAPAASTKTAAPTPAAKAAPAAAAVKEPKATPTTTPAEPAATTAAVPAPSSPPLGFVPPRKKIMLLRFCRDDFKANCPGIDLGEGRAIACLNEKLAQLTADCRGALAKLNP